jgi:hypothetical protein
LTAVLSHETPTCCEKLVDLHDNFELTTDN